MVKLAFIATSLLLLMFEQTFGVSISQIGDVRIVEDGGVINCDTLICPTNTTLCRVTKNNDPDNFARVIRSRTCFDRNGEILAQRITTEPSYGNRIAFSTNVGSGGTVYEHQMTPEEQQIFEENMRRVEYMTSQIGSDVSRNVGRSMADLNEQLRPLQDIGPRVRNQVSGIMQNVNDEIAQSMANIHNDLRHIGVNREHSGNY